MRPKAKMSFDKGRLSNLRHHPNTIKPFADLTSGVPRSSIPSRPTSPIGRAASKLSAKAGKSPLSLPPQRRSTPMPPAGSKAKTASLLAYTGQGPAAKPMLPAFKSHGPTKRSRVCRPVERPRGRRHRSLHGPITTRSGFRMVNAVAPVAMKFLLFNKGLSMVSSECTARYEMSANAFFIARLVAATASSRGIFFSTSLNGSARTGPSKPILFRALRNAARLITPVAHGSSRR